MRALILVLAVVLLLTGCSLGTDYRLKADVKIYEDGEQVKAQVGWDTDGTLDVGVPNGKWYFRQAGETVDGVKALK